MLEKRFFVLAMLLSVTGLLFAREAQAWGPYGHAIIVDIAQSHLNPETKREITRLLLQEHHETLDQVASWSDKIGHVPMDRGGLPQTLPWHYVDTDVMQGAYDRSRDCPNDLCITEKLPQMEKMLADSKASDAERLVALKWVVHLVGDLHQPLHATERNHDKGGNLMKVSYFNRNRGGHENLHALWDEVIMDCAWSLVVGPHYSIDFAKAREKAYRLNARITPGQALLWPEALTLGTVPQAIVNWTNESHALARTVVYGVLPQHSHDLGTTYSQIVLPVIETRLEQAGIRLAGVLNLALSGR